MTGKYRDDLAEHLHYAQGFDDYGVANEQEREDALTLARAVVEFHAGLTDTTDEQIADVLRTAWREWETQPSGTLSFAKALTPAVRSLLSREAARGAALAAQKDAEIERLRDHGWNLAESLTTAEAALAELRIDYANLRQNIYDKPKYDTQTKALEAAEAALATERAENERLRGIIDGATSPEGIERAARESHDTYEAVAKEVGWNTQPRSRVPWEDVPHENKATVRAAMYDGIRAALGET